MKHVYASLAVLSAILVLAGCSAPRQAMPATEGIHITYRVYGMDCPGCHGGVEKNLEKVPGVVAASANWKAKTITITAASDRGVARSEIEKAVKDSNFTLGQRVE